MAAISTKRVLIDKANTTVVTLTSVAVFVLIFCAVAVNTLARQAAYQNRVISGKKAALKQLTEDNDTVDKLKTSYNAFISTTQNVLGGNTNGIGDHDGNNADIILDALPSYYDFPALTTSLEALMTAEKVQIQSISGTDDEAAQATNNTSTTPAPVDMPFTLTAQGTYGNVQNLVGAFEKSIRPIQIQTLNVSGTTDEIVLNVTAKTYYQPAKSLNITQTVVK